MPGAIGFIEKLCPGWPLPRDRSFPNDLTVFRWNEIVSWVWYGMLTAEELGIDSTNYEEAAAECGGGEEDILVCRLLTVNFGLGTDENQLSMTWMQSVLATTGNYYEAYDRAFCDGDGTMTNCLMDRAGTANAPWWEGGLQYAPPMR